jgi:hypothetical protein
MSEIIKTIITYSIEYDKLRKEFTDYLESQCRAIPDVDQSTYVSPLDKEEILLKLQIKPFSFGEKDHVTLYYCLDNTKACQTLPLDRYPYKEKSK